MKLCFPFSNLSTCWFFNHKCYNSDCHRFPIHCKNESVWNKEQSSWFVWLHFTGTVHSWCMCSRCGWALRHSFSETRGRDFFPAVLSSLLFVCHMFSWIRPSATSIKAFYFFFVCFMLSLLSLLNWDHLCLETFSLKYLLFIMHSSWAMPTGGRRKNRTSIFPASLSGRFYEKKAWRGRKREIARG